jgi:hypothetical protein
LGERGSRGYGYHLSDGAIDLAILRFKTDQMSIRSMADKPTEKSSEPPARQ